MKSESPGRLSGILAGAAITLGCLTVGWLSVRTTAVQVLPPMQPALVGIAPHNPDRVLNEKMVAFIMKRGQLDDGDYAAIADAARAAPLDPRPYMLVATGRLMRGDRQPIIPLLEAGRRLDPQQPWLRFYLLDRYLRAGRYAEAATEFSVISRLVGDASNPIVTALVKMSIDPKMSGAVRQMFMRDHVLEANVLTQLARSGTPPRQMFAIATPVGRAAAGQPGGWGTVLVSTLTAKGDYRQARAIWQAIYGVKSAAGDPLIYDGNFRGLPGSAPFNWTFLANEVGAADRGDDGLTLSYYGRQLGEIANQLLLLAPGQYRLVFTLSGPPPSNGGPTLGWNVACDQHESPLLLDGAIPPANGKTQSIAMQFTVPAEKCQAQWLRLTGDPGQYPGTMTATVQRVALQPLQAKP